MTALPDSALEVELLRLAAEYTDLNNAINAGLHTVDGEIVDEATDRLVALERRIANRPAYTLAGVTALLRVRAACIGTRWPDAAEDRIVLLALNGLERLAAKAS